MPLKRALLLIALFYLIIYPFWALGGWMPAPPIFPQQGACLLGEPPDVASQ